MLNFDFLEQQTSRLQESFTSENGQKSKTSGVREEAAPIKPLEIRALNHLVNEYLLHHGYKLSSITFSDENEEQVCAIFKHFLICNGILYV